MHARTHTQTYVCPPTTLCKYTKLFGLPCAVAWEKDWEQ